MSCPSCGCMAPPTGDTCQDCGAPLDALVADGYSLPTNLHRNTEWTGMRRFLTGLGAVCLAGNVLFLSTFRAHPPSLYWTILVGFEVVSLGGLALIAAVVLRAK